MDHKTIKDYFEKTYEQSQDHTYPPDEFRYMSWLLTAIKPPRIHAKSLDIGCGAGFICSLLSGNGYHVYGIDISQAALNIAKENIPAGKFFLSNESEKIDLPDEYFDLTTCFGVLEHIPTPQTTVNECFRTLKKEGRAIFVVPNSKNPYFWFGGTGQIIEKPRSQKEWSALFAKSGFEIDCIKRDIGPTLSQSFPIAKRLKIMIHRIFNQLPLCFTYQFVFFLRKR